MVPHCSCGRSDRMSFSVLGCERLQLPSWLLPLCLVDLSVQLPCPQDTQAPYGEAHVAGKWGLHLAAREQLRPANSHMSLEVFKWVQSQLTTLLTCQERPWARTSQWCCSQESIATLVAKHLNMLHLGVQFWRGSCRGQETFIFPQNKEKWLAKPKIIPTISIKMCPVICCSWVGPDKTIHPALWQSLFLSL